VSHFFTVVLVPENTGDVEAKVQELLEPYREELETDANPESKWDWWRIGGRYDGMIFSAEECESRTTDNGFNWGNEHKELHRNSRAVSALEKHFHCFAIVTPDGEWHERGDMGWWGIVQDEKAGEDWLLEVQRILAANQDCLAVGCDLHI
jgi:hypothetical protein